MSVVNLVFAMFMSMCSFLLQGDVSDMTLIEVSGVDGVFSAERVFHRGGISIFEVSFFPGNNPNQKVIVGDIDDNRVDARRSQIVEIASGGPSVLAQWSGLGIEFFLMNPAGYPEDGVLWFSESAPDKEVYLLFFKDGVLVDTWGIHVESYATPG